MKIQPIDANQQTNFGAFKVRKLKIKPRALKQLTPEQQQERNYLQAIMFGLAFVAATYTKYFIDICNTKHKQTAKVEIPAKCAPEQNVEEWNK